MVLLSTMAVTRQFEGSEMIFTILKLLFFLALWLIAGIFLLPTFLRKAKEYLDEETLLILSLGLCLGMVVVATQVGFSAELGAFVMGSIIAETTSAEKVEHLIKPVKDLFGAVFFVSVGMMIDPQAMVQYAGPIILVTLLTLFGKLISGTLGALLSGQPLKQSVQVGMSMAQIGEFAFIVATLGLSLGVISEFIFPVAVGASAITTFTTPYLIKYSEPFYNFLVKVLPEKWVSRLNKYSTSTESIQADSDWKIVLKSYVNISLVNGIVLLAMVLLSLNFLNPLIDRYVANDTWRIMIVLVISLGAAAPFFWAFMAKRPNNLAYKELWLERKYNHGPLLIVEIIRNLLGVVLLAFWVYRLVPLSVAALIVIPFTVLVLFIFKTRIETVHRRLENRFMMNLNSRERAAAANDAQRVELLKRKTGMESDLLPWDAHIVEMVVNATAKFIGRTLQELAWRERFGINIVYIRRGDKLIHVPDRNSILMPLDRVGFIATDDQVQALKPVFEESETVAPEEADTSEISLEKILVDEHTKLRGMDIRSSDLRNLTNGLVVGIQRDKERILNPVSSTVLEWGDIIWIVGNKKKIAKLSRPE
jgi:CPA2 family monovalent cation:H+ antiporter-2